jgi:hypothetical protein
MVLGIAGAIGMRWSIGRRLLDRGRVTIGTIVAWRHHLGQLYGH